VPLFRKPPTPPTHTQVCALCVSLESWSSFASESLPVHDLFATLGEMRDKILGVLINADCHMLSTGHPHIKAVFTGEGLADRAALAAREIDRQLPTAERPVLEPGMGLALGQACVGDVGQGKNLQRLYLGQPIELSIGLAGPSTRYGVRTCLNDELGRRISARRPIDMYMQRGFHEPRILYALWEGEPLGDEYEEQFTKACWLLYEEKAQKKAAALFEVCLELLPDDVATERLLQKCDQDPGLVRFQGFRH